MPCLCNIDYGMFVAVLALIASIISIRYQIISLIQTQLADKARECNTFLDNNNQILIESSSISGILSSAITARQLLNYQLKSKRYYILLFLNKQKLVNQFYLQLHTSIRELLNKPALQDGEIKTNDSNDPNIQAVNTAIKETIKSQFESLKAFLRDPIEKNRNGFFDKL